MEVSDGKQFAGYMRTVRRRTLEVIGKVPEEKLNWRLSTDSMSVVDIVLHIAAVEKALWGAQLAFGKPGKVDEFAKDTVSLEKALHYMADVRTASAHFWSDLTHAQLNEAVETPTGEEIVLKRWLVLAAEHEIHHRSFVHAYRKIWGLPSSPIYGLTYDELRKLVGTTQPA